jgi:hypothetical protein
VRAAQEFVPYIQAHENAPEGSFEVRDTMPALKDFLPTDAILCRNTKPLVSLAFTFIRAGIGCRIAGRDIGQGLIKLIEKMKAQNVDRLVERLEAYQAREVGKFMAKGQETRAQAVEDRVGSILTIAQNLPENARTVAELKKTLERMFNDDQRGLLTLSTEHKSKGLEWDRVWLYKRFELQPSKWARKEWQQEQERNLIYVAYTRAKKQLICFGDGHGDRAEA